MPSESASLAVGSFGASTAGPTDLAPGRIIADKYELVRKVGSGAMGEVWAAKHVSLDEEVAIKLVRRDSSHGDGSAAESRFLLEARIASQLSRKTRHVVSVTDHGEDAAHAYLVMELLRGESLDVRLARTGPMSLTSVVPLVHQVSRALALVHADGIVHRDLKPSNVFVTTDEERRELVKILDFGIAKLHPSKRLTGMHVSGIDERHSTLRGAVLGTPVYMSPEQARGRTIDHRADVWALGVIAYHLLTGEFPFDGESTDDLFRKICQAQATPIRQHRPDLPEVVGELFTCAFAKRMDQRFQSAVAFAGALEQLDTLQSRVRGSRPAMAEVSLPPGDAIPPPGALTTSKPSASSLRTAGLPNRRELWSRIGAGTVVLAVLAATATTLSVYFEHEGTTPVAQPTAVTPAIEASGGPLDRDLVPPPEPAAVPAVPRSEPTAARAPSSALRSHATNTTAVLPPAPPPAASPPARKRVDRSEVF